MKKVLLALIPPILVIAIFAFTLPINNVQPISGAPPYYVEDEKPPDDINNRYAYLINWKRPEGPAKVALQVGHWKNSEVPDELERLKGNTGATGGGKAEWEVNYEIAMKTKTVLEEKGIVVDILPATVPVEYWADVFVAIHADGNEDTTKSGYKAATPRRDLTNRADKLLQEVEKAYEEATGLSKDPIVTINMKGYYAFSYWRYNHAVHPMTTSLILETGFLTNPSDRKIIVSKPELSAQGLANGLINFLESEGLLTESTETVQNLGN